MTIRDMPLTDRGRNEHDRIFGKKGEFTSEELVEIVKEQKKSYTRKTSMKDWLRKEYRRGRDFWAEGH